MFSKQNYVKPRISRRITHINYQKISKTGSTLIIYRKYLISIANMQLISKFNIGIQFLVCVIDIFSKYAWVVPLKGKNGITITNAF